jgi:Rod binding domain-containing protein
MDPIASTPLLSSPADLLPNRKASKIHDAAQQFEALMIGEMLKSVRESSSDGWLGSGDSDASDSALGMAEGQLATAIANGGGIGLAQMIERSVTKQVASCIDWRAGINYRKKS